MKELQVFKYKSNDVRTVEIDGNPWWVLSDVCKVLDITNHKNVAARLDEEEKGVHQMDTLGGLQEMTIINESGLYNVILRSDKPEAKPFKKWVTSEVLPSIRKHGAYMTPETLEAAILNPDTMIKLCTALKEEQDKRKALEIANSALTVDNAIMKPKADYFDDLVDRNLNTGIRETAKELGVKEKAFVSSLIAMKYLYRDKKGKLQPYAQYADDLFVLKECYNEKTQWSGTQLLITPKGRETFRLLCLHSA
ncbi:BRO family protein [Solibaculum mannosilyticum]|uniref:Putative antirepressor - phage associated n=1 Tax=Solibaculum mannosilyticum TaxID=2780922 RepID=A0A7I8D1H8_9FIRM|nr:BRO family protein [Solibaculum mannosilyticum]BCI60660.1 putative antirepressor - phage associated [Solibaculum mannosilyticum]